MLDQDRQIAGAAVILAGVGGVIDRGGDKPGIG
jgi:hypothetical protein